jgi:hypothetical protein
MRCSLCEAEFAVGDEVTHSEPGVIGSEGEFIPDGEDSFDHYPYCPQEGEE